MNEKNPTFPPERVRPEILFDWWLLGKILEQGKKDHIAGTPAYKKWLIEAGIGKNFSKADLYAAVWITTRAGDIAVRAWAVLHHGMPEDQFTPGADDSAVVAGQLPLPDPSRIRGYFYNLIQRNPGLSISEIKEKRHSRKLKASARAKARAKEALMRKKARTRAEEEELRRRIKFERAKEQLMRKEEAKAATYLLRERLRKNPEPR